MILFIESPTINKITPSIPLKTLILRHIISLHIKNKEPIINPKITLYVADV